MKVLTIKQPWATLIMQGDKRFEFRSWQTKYRGDLLIHAGKGIDKEDIKHIFERFYRVDKSHSREIGGTGLGLAITKSAVLMHKGSLTVTSTEGQGSCFLVKIPLTYIAS